MKPDLLVEGFKLKVYLSYYEITLGIQILTLIYENITFKSKAFLMVDMEYQDILIQMEVVMPIETVCIIILKINYI